MGPARYPPIADHGVIGNLHTAALISTDATIDWYCSPRFDSPSMFASLLDADRGGHFALRPAHGEWQNKQLYFPDTNVLITRFLTPDGVAEVQDFMPVGELMGGSHRDRVIRRVLSVRGRMRFELECVPRFDFGRERHYAERHTGGVLFESPSARVALETETPIEVRDGDVHASFELEEGQSATFILEHVPGEYEMHGHGAEETRELFERTVEYWRRWLAQSRYRGRWRETVHRSALTLKLLTYAPTGAIVAAPTTSLPEVLGGERNWDYRYTWIRDAAFSLYSLLRLGFTEEATAFMDWLTDRLAGMHLQESGPLQIMYGIDGRREIPEQQLEHLEGYRGSAPVRVGNNAATQLQLDIYGELVDSIYLYDKHGTPISHRSWDDLPTWSTGSARTGIRPTKESGRPAAAASSSPIRGCSAGSRSSARCGWPPPAGCRPIAPAWKRPAIRSTVKSTSGPGPSVGRLSSITTRTFSTPRSC